MLLPDSSWLYLSLKLSTIEKEKSYVNPEKRKLQAIMKLAKLESSLFYLLSSLSICNLL